MLEKGPVRPASDGYTTPPQNLLAKSSASEPAHAQTVEHARPTTPQYALPSGFVGFPVGQPRDARIQKILDESRHRMLSANDIRCLILSPDPFTERPDTDTPDWAIYKECPKQRRRAKNSDRWANSGGMKGSRDLPYNSPKPFVRRRYGSVFSHRDQSSKGKRYYEYTLLHQRDDGTTYEDKSASLFHILPGPGETDRGRRVMTNEQDVSCDQPRQQEQLQEQLQPQMNLNIQALAQTHRPPASTMRESSAAAVPQMFPLQINHSSGQDESAFVGMDMLSAVAALSSLRSETP